MAGLRNALAVEGKDLRTQVAASCIGAILWGALQSGLKALEGAGKHIGGFSVLANAPYWLSVPAAFLVIFCLSWAIVLALGKMRRRDTQVSPPKSLEPTEPAPAPLESTGIRISGGAGIRLLDNKFEGMATAISASEVTDLVASGNVASAEIATSAQQSEGLYDFLSDIEHWFHARQIARPDAQHDYAPDDPLRILPGTRSAGLGHDRDTLREYMGMYHKRAVAQYYTLSSARRSNDDMVPLVLSGPKKVWDIFRICDYLYYLDNGRRLQKWTMI